MDKVICLGKNYVEHAKELGDAVPDKPVIFLKPPSVVQCCSTNQSEIQLHFPEGRGSVHHEVEIVLRLSGAGFQLSVEAAENLIAEVSIGLDMTLREVQADLKKKGHPWTVGKVFRDSIAVGPFIPKREFAQYLHEEFSFELDGVTRQRGKGIQMTLKPAECVAYASQFFPVESGDLVFTGTPVGVGAVQKQQLGRVRWGSHLDYSVRWI